MKRMTAKKAIKPGQTLKNLDLCRIMKQCKDSGVSKFSYEGLVLEFFNNSEGKLESKSASQMAGPPQIDPTINVPQETPPSLITPQDEELLREAERSQLLIDDPEGYEEQMIAEDLEQGRVTQANEDEERDFGRGPEQDL